MIKLIMTLLGICVGMFLHQAMNDQNYLVAASNSYMAVFGGLLVWLNCCHTPKEVK